MTTPTWQAATVGSTAGAGHTNQFLSYHNASLLYQGNLVSSQTTGTGVYDDTLTQWLSQSIVTGVSQTAIGYVQLQLATIGGSPTLPLIAPLTVSLYASASGVPTGSPLATTTVSCATVYNAAVWVTVPLAASTLTPNTTYEVVTQLVGTAGHYYVWQRSNQVTGSATSPDGTTWSPQTHGLMYRVYNQSATGQLMTIYEDNGDRTVSLTYNSVGGISQVVEYTVGQTATGYLQTNCTLSYTNGLITGVS